MHSNRLTNDEKYMHITVHLIRNINVVINIVINVVYLPTLSHGLRHAVVLSNTNI